MALGGKMTLGGKTVLGDSLRRERVERDANKITSPQHCPSERRQGEAVASQRCPTGLVLPGGGSLSHSGADNWRPDSSALARRLVVTRVAIGVGGGRCLVAGR